MLVCILYGVRTTSYIYIYVHICTFKSISGPVQIKLSGHWIITLWIILQYILFGLVCMYTV